jgi:hypothetical protein
MRPKAQGRELKTLHEEVREGFTDEGTWSCVLMEEYKFAE